jgi:L-rhamnose mutarotase
MRIALHTGVGGDRVDEYEQTHTAVPPTLTDASRAAGVTGWNNLPVVWRR